MSFSTPTWAQIGEMQNQIDELHAENALKLTQILDLEQLLYDIGKEFHRNGQWLDGHDYTFDKCNHRFCAKARQATEPFWKKPNS